MKKLFCAITFCFVVTGCAVPSHIRNALQTQAKYTSIYVEKTLPLIRKSNLPESDELEGIGRRLVRNANAIIQKESN